MSVQAECHVDRGLLGVLRVLSSIPVDVPRQLERMRVFNPKLPRALSFDPVGVAGGYVAELHVREVLKRFATGDTYRFDPIRHRDRAGPFYFKKTPQGTTQAIRDGEQVCEYDAHLLRRSVPVIVEVKCGEDLSDKFAASRFARQSVPLQLYFNSETCGYVVVGPKDVVERNKLSYDHFRSRGGILVPLANTLAEITDQCAKGIKPTDFVRSFYETPPAA